MNLQVDALRASKKQRSTAALVRASRVRAK